MKRILWVGVGIFALGASSFAADASADLKKYMHSLLPQLKRAFEKGDMKFFDRISTKDFSETMGGKTYTRAESMAQMKQSYVGTKSTKVLALKILSVKAQGNEGTAMTYARMVTAMKPSASKDKKAHTMDMEMWLKEDWVRSGKGWKIKHLEEAKPMKAKMDGTPFDPSKMGG